MVVARSLALAVAVAVTACGVELADEKLPAPGAGPGPQGPADDPNHGGSGSGGGGGGAGLLTPTEYLTRLATTQCDQLFTCQTTYPGPPDAFVSAYGPAASACFASAISSFDVDLLESEVAKQRILFDGGAAAGCLTSFGQPDCATFWTHDWLWGEPCYHVFAGTVPNGDTCVTDYDCRAGGAYCDPSTRLCAPRPPPPP